MGGSNVAASADPRGERRGRRVVAALAVAVALLVAAPLAGPAAVGAERGDVAVRSVTTNAPVLAGDPLVATVTVENSGDRPAAATVRLVAGGRADAAGVRLGAGERATVRLRWRTATDAGQYPIAVAVGDARVTRTVTVADELVDSCRAVDVPGVYALATDVRERTTAACLHVTADGVTLAGGGHAVDGDGSPGTGVRVAPSARNATVRGLVVSDWRTGVAVAGDDARVRSVVATDNADRGIALVGADGTLVTAATLSSNGVGLHLADADRAVARNLTVTDSAGHGVGTSGDASTGGRLVNVTVTGSDAAGVDASAAVGLRGERVVLDGARLSFAATRARLARGDLRDRPSLPGGATVVGSPLAVETGPDGRVKATLRYGDRDASRVIEPTLAAWRHDGAIWAPVDGRVDAGANALTANVARDGVVVVAGDRNHPPAVSVTTTPDRAGVGRRVTVDASNTTDPDGRGIAAYAWDVNGDGRVDRRTRAARITHTYETTGTRTIGVHATDVDGATGSTMVDVAVVAVPGDGGEATTSSADGPRSVSGTTGDRTPQADAEPTAAEDGSGRGVIGDEAGAVLVVVALLTLVVVILEGRRRVR